MNTLNLKPTHSVVSAYYQELQQLHLLDQQQEGAVSPAFAALLRHCGRQYNWTLVEQYAMQRGAKTIRHRRRAAGQFQSGLRLLGGQRQQR